MVMCNGYFDSYSKAGKRANKLEVLQTSWKIFHDNETQLATGEWSEAEKQLHSKKRYVYMQKKHKKQSQFTIFACIRKYMMKKHEMKENRKSVKWLVLHCYLLTVHHQFPFKTEATIRSYFMFMLTNYTYTWTAGQKNGAAAQKITTTEQKKNGTKRREK